MKIRSDFVTNSSSSSFIISKKYLDEEQVEAIREHGMMVEELGLVDGLDPKDLWSIEENDNFIAGSTSMDILPMYSLLVQIDIPEEVVTWGEFPFDLDGRDYDDFPHRSDSRNWRSILRNRSLAELKSSIEERFLDSAEGEVFVVSKQYDCDEEEIKNTLLKLTDQIEAWLFRHRFTRSDSNLKDFMQKISTYLFHLPAASKANGWIESVIYLGKDTDTLLDSFIYDYWSDLSSDNFKISKVG